MSDIRTKLLLGSSIGALAMIFVMAAGVDAFDTKTTTAIQSTVVNGHVTVMAVNPDGSASYSQSDNIKVNAGVDLALLNLFDATAAAAATPFDCIQMGSGAGTSATGNDADLVSTGAACDADGLGAITAAPAADGEIEVVFAGLQAGDLIQGGGTTVTITEVTLENAAGVVISHVELDADVGGVLGTVVTITYTMSLT